MVLGLRELITPVEDLRYSPLPTTSTSKDGVKRSTSAHRLNCRAEKHHSLSNLCIKRWNQVSGAHSKRKASSIHHPKAFFKRRTTDASDVLNPSTHCNNTKLQETPKIEGYQSIRESICWLREKLRYGKNPFG